MNIILRLVFFVVAVGIGWFARELVGNVVLTAVLGMMTAIPIIETTNSYRASGWTQAAAALGQLLIGAPYSQIADLESST